MQRTQDRRLLPIGNRWFQDRCLIGAGITLCPRRHQQPFEIVGTGTTGEQMSCHPRVPPPRLRPGLVLENQFHVDVEDPESLVATHIPWVRSEEPV